MAAVEAFLLYRFIKADFGLLIAWKNELFRVAAIFGTYSSKQQHPNI